MLSGGIPSAGALLNPCSSCRPREEPVWISSLQPCSEQAHARNGAIKACFLLSLVVAQPSIGQKDASPRE